MVDAGPEPTYEEQMRVPPPPPLGFNLGHHLEYLKTLNDGKVSSAQFFKRQGLGYKNKSRKQP